MVTPLTQAEHDTLVALEYVLTQGYSEDVDRDTAEYKRLSMQHWAWQIENVPYFKKQEEETGWYKKEVERLKSIGEWPLNKPDNEQN